MAEKKKEGKKAKPGSKGEGDYYHIEVASKDEFKMFRMHDVGKEGHLQRLAGQREDGTWDTQKWLISKKDAHLDGERLIPDNEDAKKLIDDMGSIKHLEGDRFKAEA
jgi:hypothetical protein